MAPKKEDVKKKVIEDKTFGMKARFSSSSVH